MIPAAAYPVLAHAATVTASAGLTLASAVALALVVLLPGLLAGRAAAWIGAAVAAAGITLLARQDATAVVLFVPPVLINAFLAWLFGRTLGPGRLSLIERMVHLLHPRDEVLDPGIPRYAARLTAIWAAFFVVLGTVNLVLALLATPRGLLEVAGHAPTVTVPIEIWSLFANVLNYVVVAAFFAAEWFYRRRRFPQQPYRSMLDFMRRAIAVAPTLLADGRGPAGERRP